LSFESALASAAVTELVVAVEGVVELGIREGANATPIPLPMRSPSIRVTIAKIVGFIFSQVEWA